MDTVTIDLDKTRQLRYTLGSIRRLKTVCGIVFTDLDDEEDLSGDNLDLLTSLLWAGLVWEDKDLTVDDVADMVDLHRVAEVGKLVTEAIATGNEPTDPNEATV